MKYELKKIDLWSAIKVSFLVHAIVGVIVGIIVGFVFALLLGLVGQVSPSSDIDTSLTMLGPLGGFLIGLFYAVFIAIVNGVILTGLAVILYNLVASRVGGVKFDGEPAAMPILQPTMTIAGENSAEKRAGDV